MGHCVKVGGCGELTPLYLLSADTFHQEFEFRADELPEGALAHNFDLLKENLSVRDEAGRESRAGFLCSADALLAIKQGDDTEEYLVEFKNGQILPQNLNPGEQTEDAGVKTLDRKLRLQRLKRKMSDSALLYQLACGCNLTELRKRLTYILVYRADRNEDLSSTASLPRSALKSAPAALRLVAALSAAAGRKHPLLELENYAGLIYRRVWVMEKQEFADFMKDELSRKAEAWSGV